MYEPLLELTGELVAATGRRIAIAILISSGRQAALVSLPAAYIPNALLAITIDQARRAFFDRHDVPWYLDPPVPNELAGS